MLSGKAIEPKKEEIKKEEEPPKDEAKQEVGD